MFGVFICNRASVLRRFEKHRGHLLQQVLTCHFVQPSFRTLHLETQTATLLSVLHLFRDIHRIF